jgi:hypothetical protein
MALTSITKDFITRAGVIVQGTAAVSSSTAQTGALQVNAGAAIAKNLVVGSTASLYSTLYVADDLTVNNNSFYVDAQTGNTYVAGNAGINGTLNSTGTFSVDTNKFIVSSGSGNFYAEGNGGVKGTFNSTGTLSVDTDKFIISSGTGNFYAEGNGGVKGTFNSTGTLSVDTNKFIVSSGTGNFYAEGNGGVKGTFNSTGTLSVNTDKFVVDSATGNVWAAGNAGINGTLNSTGTLSVNTDKFVVVASNGNVYTAGDVGITGNVITTGTVDILSAVAATTAGGGDGALRVTGGVYVGDNLIVNSLAFDTGTNTNNALYVKGGAWIDKTLVVGGQVTFQDSVYFNGTATYVLSTNTVYTDNLLQMHVPPGGDINNHTWGADDGKDIGFIFHYFKGADQDAFLGFANDTTYLEWYDQGSESNTGTYVGTRYGIFKTGGIKLVHTTTATNTSSGALTVEGGVGIGGDLYVGGTMYANAIAVSGGGDIQATVSTATNLQYGLQGQIPINYADGKTAFISAGTGTNQVLTWNTVTYTATWVSSEQTVVGAASNVVGGAAGQIPFQSGPSTTIFDSEFNYDDGTNTLNVFNINSTGTVRLGAYDTNAVLFVNAQGDMDTVASTSFGFNSATTVMTVGSIDIDGPNKKISDTAGTGIEVYSDGTGYAQLNFNNSNYVTVNSSAIQLEAPDVLVGYNETSGLLSMSGSSDNRIEFPQVGIGAPTTSTFSGGTKIALWDNVGPSSTGYAIGIETNAMWFGLDILANTQSFKWYGHTTPIMTLTNELLEVRGALDIHDAAPTFTGSTAGAVRVKGGVGIAKDIYVNSTATFDGVVSLRNTASDHTTSSNNAMYVAGGVGIAQDLYVHSTATIDADLYVGGTIYMKGVGLDEITGSTGTFDYVFIEGTGTGLTVYDDAWIKGDTVQLGASGANQLASINTTTLEVRGGWGNSGGILNLFAGNYPTSYSKISLNGDKSITSESNTWTFKSFAGSTLVTVNESVTATNITSGAVVVTGGVGISDDLWVGDELHVAGVVELTNTTQAQGTGTDTGAVKISGGLLVKKNIVAGGLVIGGDYMGGAVPTNPSGQTVEAFKGSNNMQAGFTSAVISGSSETNLDVFDANLYTTAKYIVQVKDGSDVHSSEILLIHDGTSSYLTEYGIITNNGELGTFGADLSGGNVTLKFVPTSATAMRINVIRTSILTSISAYAV